MPKYRRKLISRDIFGQIIPIEFEAKDDAEAIEIYNRKLEDNKKLVQVGGIAPHVYCGLDRIDQEEKITKIL